MPTAANDGVSLYYEVAGEGPTVALVNDVGYGAWLWGWQHAALAGPYEVVVWDLRGTGRSDAPAGPYEVSTLAADLEAVLADHGARSAHVVGAGLGGMVALEYARSYGRAETLALLGAAATGAAVDADVLETLFAPPDDEAALRASLEPVLSSGAREREAVLDRIVDWRRADDADREGWAAQAAALRAFDATDWLHEVTLPALVCHGADDRLVEDSAAEALAAGLPRGDLRVFDGGHLFFLEESRAVNDALLGFLEDAGA